MVFPYIFKMSIKDIQILQDFSSGICQNYDLLTLTPDAEAEAPVLWPSYAKSWLIGKDPDAGRDWGQEEKGTTEDEMAGWHHWLNGHGFE